MKPLGRLDVGALADVLVVNGDPSVDISVLSDPDNDLGVMRDGLLLIEKDGLAVRARLRHR